MHTTDTLNTRPAMRMIDDAYVVDAQPAPVTVSRRKPSRLGVLLTDWAPIVLLGASAGAAGIVRLVQALAR